MPSYPLSSASIAAYDLHVWVADLTCQGSAWGGAGGQSIGEDGRGQSNGTNVREVSLRHVGLRQPHYITRQSVSCYS